MWEAIEVTQCRCDGGVELTASSRMVLMASSSSLVWPIIAMSVLESQEQVSMATRRRLPVPKDGAQWYCRQISPDEVVGQWAGYGLS